MPQTVSNIIFKSPIIDLSHNFSSADEIDSFFATLSPQTIKKWPLDFEQAGFKTKYLSVKVHPETWKDDAYCDVQAEVYDSKRSAVVEQQFKFGDNGNLVIQLESVHTLESDAYPQRMRIARLWSENNFKFLLAHDKANKPKESSYMTIHASSELTKQNIRTCGGYVWANNGFDFKNQQELNATRRAFRDYMKRFNVLLSDKNLQLFTKPCHFAAYGCGLLININGRFYHAGKAFLLQHSWFGIQKTTDKNSVERRYAHCYYNEPLPALRRKRAILVLGRKFRNFLTNTRKKTLLNRVSQRFKALRKAFSLRRFARLLSRS